jgi:beta-phosphoglucomutase
VNEIINFLNRKKVLLALITASDQRRLKQAVPQLLERFDRVVTGDTMKKGKPSPQPYLYAMKQMSLQPKDCIVIENAPLGITSAKNAGCNCIAITTTVQRRHLERADIIVASHLELLLTLKEIYGA